MHRAIRALASLSLAAPATAAAQPSTASVAAAAVGGSAAARGGLKRRLATAAPRGGRGGAGGESSAPGGGRPQREDEDDMSDETWERAVRDPKNVAARREMVKHATALQYDERVPVNFAALEEAEFEDASAAAAAGTTLAGWRGEEELASAAARAGGNKRARRAGAGKAPSLADAVRESPDALHRIEAPSPQARVTSLTADPYGWPMSERVPKQAP